MDKIEEAADDITTKNFCIGNRRSFLSLSDQRIFLGMRQELLESEWISVHSVKIRRFDTSYHNKTFLYMKSGDLFRPYPVDGFFSECAAVYYNQNGFG